MAWKLYIELPYMAGAEFCDHLTSYLLKQNFPGDLSGNFFLQYTCDVAVFVLDIVFSFSTVPSI